ncbi:Bacteriophage lambda head decoration protein D [Thiohalospira halophila DSM 15071]|uniref:Bacteriophage lambda head decoration protein D n=1 Tax=Thiohalospira halophila DSM 15071 TaxID=1123397 RepID=A0A1I1UAF0_9GAMM|nr:head decoration protein [Thiohalospira halophila]SFD67841.1 Bacteriophage lambda head decoration protein D [Thiohalospira halophila DSM 15071]
MLEEAIRNGEMIISEGPGAISRDTVTIGTGNLPAGQVLGKVTATGNYVAYSSGATDGSEVAAAILYAPADASGGAVDAVAVTRLAEIDSNVLTGLDDSATDQLADNYIIVR